jgi:hypothetical protein
MTKQTIFISCGQYTEAEKLLGSEISQIVRDVTDYEPFFAEEVQDLNGLDANILAALRDCAALITILHPRGEIERPDGSVQIRASVWIEQEIAIATYIQRVERRSLPIIAFKHASVSREGIRDLLHLNPIEFTHESEVLAALPERLAAWRSLKPFGVQVKLTSIRNTPQDGHPIRKLVVTLFNDTGQRIKNYDLEVGVPAALLKHWSAVYPMEVRRDDIHRRYFRFNEADFAVLNPRSELRLASFDYCTTCALADAGRIGTLVADAVLDAKVWIDGREYSVEKTIKDLAEDRENEQTRY